MKNIIIAAAFAMLATAAQAQSVNGVWAREDGSSKMRIADCGGVMCGTITWTNAPRKDVNNPDESKRGRSTVGVQVFYGMAANGANALSGKAYNPEDGKTYTGKMTLAGDKLTTQGCALGGMICKSAAWTRSN